MRRKIFSPILGEVGWEKKETDGHTDALLRNMLVGTLGHSGDTEVIEKCREMFKLHTKYVLVQTSYTVRLSSNFIQSTFLVQTSYKVRFSSDFIHSTF